MWQATIHWMLLHPFISIPATTALCYLLLVSLRPNPRQQPPFDPRSPKHPPTAPNFLPILGHLLSFTLSPASYTTTLTRNFPTTPLRLHLLSLSLINLPSPTHVAALFRHSSALTNRPYRAWVNSVFGVPRAFREFLAADTSGISRTPIPGTEAIKPNNRAGYLMHSLLGEHLSGVGLKALGGRFARNMERRLGGCCDGGGGVGGSESEGREFECMYEFVKTNMLHASVTAIWGTGIFEIDPEFSTHFWVFEHGVPELGKGLPRFVYRRQNRARDRCLATMRAWNESLDEQRARDPERARELAKVDYDDVFGSRIVKRRHEAFERMDVMSVDVRASEDFALVWGNANTTHATFWLIHSLLRDHDTLQRFRAEIEKAEVLKEDGAREDFVGYDVDALCALPYVQSLYAETLRLYVCNIIMRSPHSQALSIDGWEIGKGEIAAAFTYPMHRDASRFITTGPEGESRPLSEFWTERFLVSSGEFSLKGSEDAWFPYGGGSSICPGRFFAKQEMLVTAALLIGNYDVELTGGEVEVDWRYFGIGVLGVKGKQPFRLRPRMRV